MKVLDRNFYIQSTTLVAEKLLGCLLVHSVDGIERIGRIVEVEAYVGAHDLASHSSKKLTKRSQTMFGPPGHAYIYLIYGIHHCMNVVTEPEGNGCAVLIRALEPLKNITGNTQGPGLLCKAMHIGINLNGYDLLNQDFYIAAVDKPEKFTIRKTPRIGLGYAGMWTEKMLRFYIAGNPFVSRP